MVRDGEKPNRVEAACCNVEVLNGARAFRCCSDSITSRTTHVACEARC